jgi:hypothetical protein
MPQTELFPNIFALKCVTWLRVYCDWGNSQDACSLHKGVGMCCQYQLCCDISHLGSAIIVQIIWTSALSGESFLLLWHEGTNMKFPSVTVCCLLYWQVEGVEILLLLHCLYLSATCQSCVGSWQYVSHLRERERVHLVEKELKLVSALQRQFQYMVISKN